MLLSILLIILILFFSVLLVIGVIQTVVAYPVLAFLVLGFWIYFQFKAMENRNQTRKRYEEIRSQKKSYKGALIIDNQIIQVGNDGEHFSVSVPILGLKYARRPHG